MNPARDPDPQVGATESGPYTRRPLISDIPLSADGDASNVRITCVEVWGENLYIGTSAAEILHFVQIPPDPSDASGQPTYIIASRLQPPVIQQAEDGVQQILLLPTVNKACILCNNTLSFYSLPELSPAFPRLKPLNCVWVGGIDQNEPSSRSDQDGVIIMLCLKTRIRLVKIADSLQNPHKIRDIELGGCLATSRRGDFACVSDAHSYSLLDVVHQQRIPLFPISSIDEPPQNPVGPPPETWPAQSRTQSRSVSSAGADPRPSSTHGHGRSTSLGIFATSPESAAPPERSPRPLSGRYGFDAPESLSRMQSPAPARSPAPSGSPERGSTDKALPPPPQEEQPQISPPPSIKHPSILRPHVVSPTVSEFLLTTGTALTDPGVGMFVNLDGDVVRGTIEFSSYPSSLVVDGKGIDLSASTASGDVSEEGYVLAVVQRKQGDVWETGIETQRWDIDPGEGVSNKTFMTIKSTHDAEGTVEDQKLELGLRQIVSSVDLSIPGVGERLALTSLNLESPQDNAGNGEVTSPTAKREKEELEFSRRLGNTSSRLVTWYGSEVHWLVKSPLVMQLDARLESALADFQGAKISSFPSRQAVEAVFNDLRGLESRTELEFIGFAYIRQKAAFIMFAGLLVEARHQAIIDHSMRTTKEALLACDLDPRVLLSFLPVIRNEVVYSKQGIWVYGGLKPIIQETLKRLGDSEDSEFKLEESQPGFIDILQLTRAYLLHWRRKKGFGSIADATEIFSTVDAALLHVLLILDKDTPKGPATAGSIRAELNAVVGSGVDCFDRAVILLEQYKRLYVLSRLYHHRKLSSRVVQTWKRIISGEEDVGGEFTDGEHELRRYLSKTRDTNIVKEYGTWLAARNPKLGVQVFADDHSKVTFTPSEALQILREGAPDAVKEYLEFLVFGKKQTQHANELISYYLTNVLDELSSSEEARSTLLQTYETYRALAPPKPTYKDFITDNAIPSEWWNSRLRLLQLLGGGLDVKGTTTITTTSTGTGYDTAALMEQLHPYERELVPEMIILHGQQQRHEEAVRLLVHGLGDFDTAIRYCLLGGSSLFPGEAGPSAVSSQRPSRVEQSRLFGFLLREFLALESVTERVERTGELLERFGAWFDVGEVLIQIPDSWSIDIVSGFIIQHLRRLVHERAETSITRALSGAVNLKTSAELTERTEALGSVVEG
ncbi:hypothetical protein NA57DRAFT_50317 [Rhizodiscina lignyota]|uniref:CNH domain-containing protein n=1 Tax=Rhizodiscina lignyota TaxID=1504668 RepID=A0A9P4I011_9PEZI|nr:hypothetical protein NA57DRAFT_50317 [Rhizodiscina lignyota]